jgi:Flp pilus assembly protein TadG
MSGHRRRGDRGTVLVEAALVLPLLMVVLLGMFDFTFAELKESDATNAARDGARIGMLDRTSFTTTPQADCSPAPPDPAFTTICEKVRSNLSAAPVSSVQVRCYPALGPAVDTATPVACNHSTIRPDRSTIEVRVVWQREPMTFVGRTFFGAQTVTTTSRMVVTN